MIRDFPPEVPLKCSQYRLSLYQLLSCCQAKLQMTEMPRPPGSSDPDLWTLDLPPSLEISVGSLQGARICDDGTIEQERENEDRSYTCRLDNVQLYLVLDGHYGSRACDYALKHIPSLLLRYHMGEKGEKAAEALKYVFENTEKHFFMMLDPSITRKMGLQMEIQEKGGTTSMLAYSMCPDKVDELQRLEDQIRGGTTAVVALILNNRKLWVANVGDSRAVLCYLDGEGKLRVEQISEDHNTKNEKELARLAECGLDEMKLRSSGRLGIHQNTRSIGDYSIKGGYKDHDILSTAIKEPGTAEPFISHPPLDITTICGFLLLMSDGLYDAYAAVTKSLHTVNHDIAVLVQQELDLTHNLADVAQRVAGFVTSEFQAMLSREHRGARLDDITLVVRNLGYPMGKLAGTTTAPPSVQNPFNFSQPPRPQHHYENTDYHHQYPGQQFSAATGGGGYNPAHYSQTQILVPRPDHMQMPHLSHASMRPTVAYTQMQQPHQFQVQPNPYAPSSTSGMRRSGSDSRVNQPYTSSDISSIPTGVHPQSGQGGDMRYGGNFGGGLEPQHQYQTQVPATSVPQHIPAGGAHAGFSQQYSAAASAPLDNRQNPGAYHTTTHNQPPPPTSPRSPRHNYENWPEQEPEQEPRQGHHSSGSASEIVGQLANVHVSSPPPPQLPPKPQGTAMPSAAPTNAESQYQQSSQQVLPPPVAYTSQPPTSQYQTPNSIQSTPTVPTSIDLQKTGNMDDEEWMYGHASKSEDVVDAETPMNAPQPNFTVPTQSSVPVEPAAVGGEVIGESALKGRVGDNGTEIVELEMPSDREDPSDMEGEEEEDGMIKPIIKFDKFPPDLSWDDI